MRICLLRDLVNRFFVVITQVVIKRVVFVFTLKDSAIKRWKDLESMQETVTEITLRRKKNFLLPFIGLQTKAVKSLICFKKTSKSLLIISKI